MIGAKSLRQAFAIIDPQDKRRIGVQVALILLQSGLEMAGLAGIYLMLKMFDGGTNGSSSRIDALFNELGMPLAAIDAQIMAIALGLLFALKTVAAILIQRSQMSWIWRAWARSSENLLAEYLRAPYAFHLQSNSTHLMSRLEQLGRFYRNGVMPALEILTEIVVALVVCLTLMLLSWQVVVLAAGLLGGLALTYEAFLGRGAKRWGKTATRSHSDFFQAAGQALGGVRDIKLFQVPGPFVERFRKAAMEHGDATKLNNFYMIVPRYGLEFIFIFGLIVAFLAISRHEIDIAELMPLAGTFAVAGLRLLPSLFRIMNKINSLRFTVPLLEKIHQDVAGIKADREPWSHEGNVAPLGFAREIRAEGLGCRFEGTGAPALSGIDLVIRKGESVAFVGGSGAGKTTLAHLLIGLYLPTAGRVAVDGVSVADNLAAWRLKVAYVPQDPFLTDDSLRRNIAFGLSDDAIDEAQLRQAVEQARLQSYVEALPDGLDTVVGERGMRLSGGQKQRIAIARALYFRREVLVLDEATAALDAKTEAEITEAIDSLRHRLTMITIAHRLSTVQSCDRIYFLKNGAIDGVGTFDELLRDHADFKEMAVHMGMISPNAAL